MSLDLEELERGLKHIADKWIEESDACVAARTGLALVDEVKRLTAEVERLGEIVDDNWCEEMDEVFRSKP